MEHSVFDWRKLGARTLKLGALLAAAALGLSQGENEPYFALFNNSTFASGGRPSVSLTAWNVDALEFRVYRVSDPLQFFEQLEDPHQFGGRAPRPPRERTALERFHLWKHSLRTRIRGSLRAQFTESVSAHFGGRSEAEPKSPAPAAKGTAYTGAPVLNPRQLVLTFSQPVRSRSRWQRDSVEVGVRDKGVYLVEAVHGELRAYTILMVSDVAMITKTGKGRIVNLLVDRKTGQPVPAARIALLARDKHLRDVETNAEGIAELKMPAAAVPDPQQADFRIVAVRGGDVAINSLASYAFGADRDAWMGYIYTDRPVYRPGHTVHLKGILRSSGADGYQVPAGKPVSVTIHDPDGKPVYQKTLTAGANGTVHDDLTLAAGAPLGNYFIEMKSGQGLGFMNANFEVEEYKKPEYEVRVSVAKPRVLQGERVQATIDARYYFGEPVNGAKVKYSVYRDRYWFPLWHDAEEESEEPQAADDSGDSGDQISETEAQLDSEGKLTITIPTTASDHKYDYVYGIVARVTDAANREITGKGWVVATYGSFALNVEPERYFYAPGGKAGFTVEARTYDNQPVRARARVELLQSNRRYPDQWDARGSTDVDLGPDGKATAYLDIPQQGGSYRLRATARTPEGRDVEDDAYLWVSGAAGGEFRGGREQTIQIVSDRKTYRAGDTAKLLILAGQSDTPVYVTVEGRDLRQYKLVRPADSTVSFELPVTAADEPGIAVSAAFVRQGKLYNGSKYVRIPPVEHGLNVKVATDKPQYLPGQAAEYSIDVTDFAGKPAPRAEFSLGVVDEAIYGVRPDSTENILQFFFGRQGNRVYTDNSLEYYFNGEAGKRRIRLSELRPASRLAQLKPERLVQPKIRKAFPDTAFWSADLVTDSAGHARARVEFPDSLTTWRATARGVTADTKVGNAVLKTIVRKNLIVRLAVPRFFVEGDEVTVSALVHNYLADAKTARVSLDVTGLDVLEGSTRDVEIPSRGEARLDWRVRAQQVRGAKLTAKALTNEESDALEMDLPVNVPGVKMAVSRGGALHAGGEAAFDLAFPQNVRAGSRSLAIRISPSIAGSLFGALEFLTSFPYGCVEQTMSSFLPNIVVRQAIRELGVKADLDQAALDEKIRAGLDRLYGLQHEDGGWGWWETDESQPFMTAYVVAGLAQAQAAGTQVDADRVKKGAAWLSKDFTADPRLAADLRAYMAYALALAAGDAAPSRAVYDKLTNLSPYGLAILGLALEQAKDARAGAIAAELERRVEQDQEQAWWTATRDQMLDFSEDVTPEATAYAVKFLSRERPASPLLPKAAVWLMNHRNEGYWWSSTKQTAMVIYGLTDYLKASGELNPNVTATVTVNDKPVLTRKLDQATGPGAPELTLDESKLQPGVNHIRIAASGAGRLYYSTRAEYSSEDARLQKAGTVSLNVLRDYFRLAPTRAGDRIVYDTTPLEGPAAVGDIIAVRLTVTGSEWKYVMLEDPIPAGTEFIERDNAYELKNRPPWWAYGFTRRELHDDRLAIFQTYSPQGQQQYFYLLKVVNPGVFQVSPARVGPMYQTDVMATSESRRLEVK
jgi:alpha-2-macroglobulin